MIPQPHWSVWYPKPDLASWSRVEKPLIRSPVYQSISFGVFVWPWDLSCKWVCITSTMVKVLGQLKFSVLSPLLPAHWDQYLYLPNYQKLEAGEGRAATACGGGRREADITLGDTGHVTCRLHCTPTTCTLRSQTWIPIKPSAKHCSMPTENFTSCAGWSHSDVRIPEKTGKRGLTNKHTRIPLFGFSLPVFFYNDSIFIPWKTLKQCQHRLQPWACWQKRMFYK